MDTAARPLAERVVVMVDDEEVVCLMTTRILKQAGFRVLEAHDGAGALYLLATLGPSVIDLVVSDIAMPRVGGVELAEIMAERWPGLPILLVSGQGSPEADYTGAFLPKPFTHEALLSAVASLLSAGSPSN